MQFIKESEENLEKIMNIIQDMDEEELDEFGAALYYEFFDDEESEEDDYDSFGLEDVESMIKELGSNFYEDVLDLLDEVEDDEELDESSKMSDIKQDKKTGEYFVKNTNITFWAPNSYGGTIGKDGKKYWSIKVDNEEVHTIKGGDNSQENVFDYVLDLANGKIKLNEAVSRIMKQKNMNRKKRKFMSLSKAKLRQSAAARKKKNRMTKAARKRYYRANKQKIAAYQKSRRSAIKKGKHKVKLRRSAG